LFSVSQDSTPATNAQSVLAFLNQSIRWYRQAVDESQAADPDDAIFAATNRQLAGQYLRLAFDYARAQAALLDAEKPANTNGTATAASSPNLQQSLNQTSTQLNESERELAQVEGQLERSSGSKRRLLEAQRDELKSEIALAQTRQEILQTFVNYRQTADPSGRGKVSLSSQIEELAQTVPGVQLAAPAKEPQPTKTSIVEKANVTSSTPSNRDERGLLASITSLFALRQDLSAVNEQVQSTADLRDTIRKLIAPLRAGLSEATQRGTSISAAAQADDIALLNQQKAELDSLTRRFKQISAVALPLGRSGMLLDSYKANLADWHKQLEERASSQLRYVAIHLSILAAVIGFIMLLSAAWRRATLKYVLDVRRQNQILLVRRIVVAGLIMFVLAMTLIAEVGALATYAGLVTAGLAVALQNIILSVIAYFFLIGRYGVHIGDRVTIAGITGKVSEIGLLRFHLLEMKGEETDLHLSGRVVVFSNSVILQPTSHFFKQAPATDFLWHEMKLTCDPDTDYWELERRLRSVLGHVYANHTHAIDDHRQQTTTARKLPQPVVKVMVGRSGVIIVVRYPVYTYASNDFDEQVTRAVLSIIHRTRGVELSSSADPEEVIKKD
jgi:small-conductance mechanosensitive channel